MSNKLRDYYMNPEEVEWDLFTDSEKNELAHQLFGMLVVGGSLCQWDDVIEPYLNTFRSLYRDCVG